MDDRKELETRFIKDLLEKRIIYLEGDIDGDSASKIGKGVVWLNVLGEQEIVLYIDSNGGYVSAGLDIYDIIRHSRAPVVGVVYRRANSMASVILQACQRRKAMRHSELALHDITTPPLTLADLEDQEKLKNTRRAQEEIYQIINQRSGMAVEEVRKICKEGKKLSADEALGLGLIDEVI
jgi:ATP-dependent Clp protease protease subunit